MKKAELRAAFKEWVNRSPWRSRQVWRASRQIRALGAGGVDWSQVKGAPLVPDTREKKKKILVATSIGAHLPSMTCEGVIGAALAVRGCDVRFLLCDKVLPACMDCESRWEPGLEKFAKHGARRYNCDTCFDPGYRNYNKLGLTCHRYSDVLGPEDRHAAEAIVSALPEREWPGLVIDNVFVGDHAKAGLLRFLARGTMTWEVTEIAIFRRYVIGAILTLWSVQRLLARERFDAVVLNHGIYVPQGIIAEACRNAGVRVVTWNIGYRKNCLLFNHDETYHHGLMSEPVSSWENMIWSEAHEKFIADYLKSRWYGTNDWIWFHDRPTFDLGPFARETGFDPNRPAVGLLTNVFWDAQLHYPKNVFDNMLEWIFETIDYFVGRPDIQLLIRVHPAEIRGTVPARELVADAIRARYSSLPPNIILVGPENRISTYPIMEACNAVIIYGTKTGVELTSVGIPTIVAGEAWIKGKGLTVDPISRQDYFAQLDRLPYPSRMAQSQIDRAHRYAFHFFFRRMIPVSFLKRGSGFSPIEGDLQALDQLLPGRDAGLDLICRGIMDGVPFVFPAEEQLPR